MCLEEEEEEEEGGGAAVMHICYMIYFSSEMWNM
jgi:hypothetical protein